MTARRASKATAQPEQPEDATSIVQRELAHELIVDAYNLRAVDPKVMKVLVDDEDGRKAVIDQLAWMRSIEVDYVGIAHRAGVPELLDELPPIDPAAVGGEGKQEN